jgi:O-antigen ligase
MTMQTLLIALLLLSPTVQARIDLGPFSFALLEPFTLAAATLLLWRDYRRRGRLVLAAEPLWPLLLLMAAWVLTVRLFGESATRALSDARDWLIPIYGYLALISSVRDGWRRWTAVLLIGLSLQAALGIYQALSDSARPFINEESRWKTGFNISPETAELAQTSFAAGLFGHPNGLAIVLFGGLLLLISTPAGRGLPRPAKPALTALLAAALVLTYAKASLTVMALALSWYGLQRVIVSGRRLLLISAAAAVGGLLLLPRLLQWIPPAYLETLYWRIGLWQQALDLLRSEPALLLLGRGLELFGGTAYYPQPHNNFLYMTLEYGLFGLLWFITLSAVFVVHGWWARSRGCFAQEPRLAGLWLFLLGFLLISSVESTLQGIEMRAILLNFFACYSGLLRETRAAQAA